MHTARDLRNMTVANILKELTQARHELMEHRLRVVTGQEHTHHKLRAARRYIARMLTVLAQKQSTITTSTEAEAVAVGKPA